MHYAWIKRFTKGVDNGASFYGVFYNIYAYIYMTRSCCHIRSSWQRQISYRVRQIHNVNMELGIIHVHAWLLN